MWSQEESAIIILWQRHPDGEVWPSREWDRELWVHIRRGEALGEATFGDDITTLIRRDLKR